MGEMKNSKRKLKPREQKMQPDYTSIGMTLLFYLTVYEKHLFMCH